MSKQHQDSEDSNSNMLPKLVPWVAMAVGLLVNMLGLAYGYGGLTASNEQNRAAIAQSSQQQLEYIRTLQEQLNNVDRRLANIEGRLGVKITSLEILPDSTATAVIINK